MALLDTITSVYRDYVTYGVPASGDHEPVKSEIRGLLAELLGAITGGGELSADLAEDLASVAALAEGVANDAAAASASEAAALSYKNAALAALAGLGFAAHYATKAAANAGLAGLTNGDLVMVLEDESQADARTIYEKVAGAYVLRANLSDSAIMTYTAPFTGAGTRSVALKLSDQLSILDHADTTADGVTPDTDAILEMLDWCNTYKKTLYIPSGTKLLYDGGTIGHDWVSIVGEARPSAASDRSELVGGAIVLGTLWFTGRTIQLDSIGVDHGSANFGSGNNCIVLQPADGYGSPGEYSSIRNCIALGRAAADAYHSFAVEGHRYFTGDNNIGIRNTYGLAAKVTRSSLGSFKGIDNGSRGVILKGDPVFGKLEDVEIGNVVVYGTGTTTYGVQVLIQGTSLAPLTAKGIIVGNVSATGVKYIASAEVENSTGGTTVLESITFGDIIGDFTDFAFYTAFSGDPGGAIKSVKHGSINAKGIAGNTNIRVGAYASADFVTGGDIFVNYPSGAATESSALLVGSTVGRSKFGAIQILIGGVAATPAGGQWDTGPGNHHCDAGSLFVPSGVGAPLRPGMRAASIPTTGTYQAGEFVANTAPAIDGSNMVILGWLRLTNGSAHVSGTDWAVVRGSTVSPAT